MTPHCRQLQHRKKEEHGRTTKRLRSSERPGQALGSGGKTEKKGTVKVKGLLLSRVSLPQDSEPAGALCLLDVCCQ